MPEQIDLAEFARRAQDLVRRVAEEGRAITVQHAGGRPAAVLISAAEYQTWQRLKGQRQARFRRDLELIHRAADEATLVNGFSEDQARDLAKQAQQEGRGRILATEAAVRGVGTCLPHFADGPTPGLPDPGPSGVPRMMLDAHQLLTYLVGSGKELRPMLDAWAEGRLEVLVPRFLLLDLRGGLDALAEQGRLDPEAGECLLELLAREGEPVADPLLPAGFLPGWRGRFN
jgi:prevent-host-death family protein